MYRVLLYGGLHGDLPAWRESGEGPFDTAELAIEFADAECGVAWIVVGAENRPIAFGDAGGAYDAKPLIPDSTAGWAE